jgi:hypothetical protein
MSKATHRFLKDGAIRGLENYPVTRREGIRWKGLDRVNALGVVTANSFRTDDEIRHLVNHVRLYC